MIKNISVSYANDIVRTEVIDRIVEGMKGSINAWFSKYEDEINKEDGIVEIFIDKFNEPHISVDNISEDLKDKVMVHLSTFENFRH